jgi:hypothetical protein
MPNPQRLEFITRQFNDLQTIRLAPLPMAMLLAGLLWYGFFARAYFWDLYVPSTIFIGMLTTVVDSTNIGSRRIAWAIGLVVLFSVGPLLLGVDGGAAIFSLAGGVWLSLSIFDFVLLRRTFAEISADPPTAVTEGVVRYG